MLFVSVSKRVERTLSGGKRVLCLTNIPTATNFVSLLVLLSLILFIGLVISPLAQSQTNPKLQAHGFIAQGVAKSSGSDFVNDDQDLSFALTEIGVNASYQVNERLRLAGQVVYLNAGNRLAEGARVDYALLDWSLIQSPQRQLDIYLGRYKNYHWLYSSTRDVPMTRPSIVLPQSVYFDAFRDIGVGADGVALAYKYNHQLWGDFDLNLSYGTSDVSRRQMEIILSNLATGDMKNDFDAQGSIYWQPQNSQWRFGLALLDAEFSYDRGNTDVFDDATFTFQRYILNAIYEGERWEFSGELMQERFSVEGFYLDNFQRDNFGQGFFVQSRYQLSSAVKLLARFERFYADKDDRKGRQLEQNSLGTIPGFFAFQHDTVLGATISLASNLEVKLEHHWVEGTARLTPVVVPDPEINNDKYWQLSAIQLTYWF